MRKMLYDENRYFWYQIKQTELIVLLKKNILVLFTLLYSSENIKNEYI